MSVRAATRLSQPSMYSPLMVSVDAPRLGPAQVQVGEQARPIGLHCDLAEEKLRADATLKCPRLHRERLADEATTKNGGRARFNDFAETSSRLSVDDAWVAALSPCFGGFAGSSSR
jgi:hypothetical protein